MKHCPTCGHKIYERSPVRTRKCSECGASFKQQGLGRTKLTCSPKCALRRKNRLSGRGWALVNP